MIHVRSHYSNFDVSKISYNLWKPLFSRLEIPDLLQLKKFYEALLNFSLQMKKNRWT